MIKLYQDFLAEAESKTLMDQLLNELEPTILRMIDVQEKFKIYDLVRSIEIYTLPTDTLISVTPKYTGKGSIAIYAKVQRGDESYILETEAIVAGGWNIQRAHYRYITKATPKALAKTGTTQKASEYADKIKKLNKVEKLNQELQNWEERVEKAKEHLARAQKFTDDEIFKKYQDEEKTGSDPSWEEIVARGADKNFNYDKNEYEKFVKDNRQRDIEFWKTKNIVWKQNEILTGGQEIAKLKKKIEAALA